VTSRKVQRWAERICERYAPEVGELIGATDIPAIRVRVEAWGRHAAWTSGTDIFVSYSWFAGHPDDSGAVIHELTHAVMQAPIYGHNTRWLLEGLADYVRDELGHDAPWTKAHHEPGKAMAGYQTTAHFLQHVERRHPGTVKQLAQALMNDTYSPEVFLRCTGSPLYQCVSDYEAEATGA